MEAPPPSPSVSERTKRLEALEKWREEVDGRIEDVEVRSGQLRKQYEQLYHAYVENKKVREACKQSVGNLQSTMQREIANLKKEIAQMKGTVDDDGEVVFVKTVPASSGTKRPRSIRLKI